MSRGPGSRSGYEDCRVIRTARTERAINAAVDEGFLPLVMAVKRNPDVHFMFGVDQDPKTGRIKVQGDLRCSGHNMVLDFDIYYPYNFPSPFAAYLIPPDLAVGEVVWLEDLIEDIVAIWGNQSYHPRLASGPALWDGKNFAVLFNSLNDAQEWVG